MWIQSFSAWRARRRKRRKFRRRKIYNPEYGFSHPDNLVRIFLNQLTQLRESWDIGIKPDPSDIPVTQQILAKPAEERLKILLDALWAATDKRIVEDSSMTTDCPKLTGLWRLIAVLARKNLPYNDQSFCVIFGLLGSVRWHPAQRYRGLYRALERFVAKHGVSEQLREALQYYQECRHGRFGNARIKAILGDLEQEPADDSVLPTLQPTMWGRKAREWIDSLGKPDRDAWIALFNHAEGGAKYSRPRKRWLEHAHDLIEQVGPEKYSVRLTWLLEQFDPRPFEQEIEGHKRWVVDVNQPIVIGLIWAAQFCGSGVPVEAIRQFAVRCYAQRVYGEPYAERLGNSCLLLLDSLTDERGLSALFELHGDIVHGRGRKIVERNIKRAARRLGKTVEELGEYAIPTFGMDEKGRRRGHIDQYRVTISVDRNGVVRAVQTDPEDPKKRRLSLRRLSAKYYFEVVDFQQLRDQIEREIYLQTRKIEELYVSNRVRTVGAFRRRYLKNPLVAHLVRRLIWVLRAGGREHAATIDGDTFIDIDDKPIPQVTDDTVIFLWHPLNARVEEVRAWRRKISAAGISQPFEQACREIFIPTDAELETETYSNRFAGYFVTGSLRYRSLNALGWSYVGGTNWRNIGTATRVFPNFGLKAEFDEDRVSSTADGSEIDHSMSSTDCVRFFRSSGQKDLSVPIAEVPPLVFSEVMHDLSKAVAGSAKEINFDWRDHTEDDRPDWYHLRRSLRRAAQDANMRLKRLQDILPRLAIADRCEISPPYLDIRGKLATYRIHAGNAAVFRQPNGQHLCILAKPGISGPMIGMSHVIEMDTILTTVLNKALLLADDDTITDRSILSQFSQEGTRAPAELP